MYTLEIDIEQEVAHLRGQFYRANFIWWPEEHLVRVAGQWTSSCDRAGCWDFWLLRGQSGLMDIIVVVGWFDVF